MAKSKKKKYFLGCFLIFILLGGVFTASVLYFNEKFERSSESVKEMLESQEKEQEEVNESDRSIANTETEENADEDSDPIDEDKPSFPQPPKYPYEKPVSELQQTIWIPTWDFYNGLNSLRAKNTLFNSISPVWYSVNADGTLVDRRNSQWGQIISSAGTAEIIPSIAISDAELLHSVLSNDQYYTNHLNAIVSQVIQYNYDGIDIDYEMIYAKDTDRFRSFIEDLDKKLAQEGKMLSITLLTQWGDDVVYTSLPETRSVQDYAWAGSVADQVRIMTYDYTSGGSKEPGPIAPITWMERVISYATEKIPREKLWMGIHLYGYQWSNLGGVKATTYSQIPELQKITDYKYMHDASYGEGVATYTCGTGLTCTLFFQDEEGVRKRKELAAKYGIKGVAYWRLGGEGDLIK